MGRARALRGACLAAVLALAGAGAAWGQVTPPQNWTATLTGPTSITEGQRATYTITLSEAQPYDGQRLLAIASYGPAASGAAGLEPSADYGSPVSSSGRFAGGRAFINFDLNSVSHTFSLLITDDMVAELDSDENFQVSLVSIGWIFSNSPDVEPAVDATMNSVTTTIQDPRTEGLVSIIGPLTAADNGSDAVFTVRVDGTSTAAVTVNYSVGATGDSATRVDMASDSGADYVSPASDSVTVSMGEDQTATITIATVDAEATESSEFFTVTLTTVSGGGTLTPTLGGAGAASRSARASIFGQPVTIAAAVTSTGSIPSFSGALYAEGETITITLTLSGPQPISDIIVPYQIGHAGTIAVRAEDFGLDSLQQERHITLAEMAAARRMDNPQPITISLPVARDGFLDVSSKFADLVFSASRPARGGGLGAITLTDNAGFMSIVDDQSRVLIEMRAMDVDEDGGAQDGFQITVAREDPGGGDPIVQLYSGEPIGMRRWTLSGTATLNTDYTLSDGGGLTAFVLDADDPNQQHIAVGSTIIGQPMRGVVRVTPTDNSAYGGDQTITITLTGRSNFSCAGTSFCPSLEIRTRTTLTPAETDTRNFNPATLTIIDDEPQLSIAAPVPGSIAEGGAAVFTVTLRNPPDMGSVSVDWALGTDSDADTNDAATADFSGNTSGTLTFMGGATMGGATTQTITLQSVVDSTAEMVEVFTVTLSNAMTTVMGGVVGIASDATTATASIAANTAVSRTLALSAGDTSVTEGSSLSYTVTMTGSPPATGNDVTVSWSVGADADNATTDAAAGDFDDDGDGTVNTNLPSGSVTFTSSDATGATKTFPVQTAANTLSQVDRTYVVTITASGGGGSNTVNPATHTTTIDDDDPLTASLTLADDSLVEGTDTSAAFGVSLSGASGVTPGEAITATLEVVTADTTATGGASADANRDYTTPASFVTMVSMGATTQGFAIALNDDNLNEGAETLALRLVSVSGGNAALSMTASDLTKTATIAANDATTVAVSGPGTSVAEGANAVFTFTFAGGVPSADISLPYTVTGVLSEDLSLGASGLQNVISISATTVANAGVTPVTFSLGIAEDGVTEGAETLTLTLDDTAGPPERRPGGAGGGGLQIASAADSGTATATIAANEPATLAVSAAAASVDENASSAEVVFELALQEGMDARTVPAVATVTYQLGGAAAGGAGTDAARDYTRPTGYDTATDRGTVTIAANTGTASVTLPLNNDSLNEADEAITFTLISVSGGGGGTLMLPGSAGDAVRMASASIADDDDLTVSVSGPGSEVTEGSAVSFTVTVSGGTSTAAVMVPWTVAADSDSMTMDAAAADFDEDGNAAADTGFPSGTLTINAGDASGAISVQTFADGAAEMAEVFVLSLSSSPSSTTRSDAVSVSSTAGAATVTIAQNTALSRTVNLSGPTALAEGATSANYTVAVGGSAPTADITVTWAIGTDSDAATVDAAAADFSGATSGTLTFTMANHNTAQNFTLTSLDNTASQADKVFTVTITISGGGTGTTTLGTSTVTTTIEDNDPLTASLSISNANLDEETDTAATFRISLSGADGVTLGEPATITWEIDASSTATGGEATDAARDYTTPAAVTTTVAMNTAGADLSIALNNDALNEGAETIVVRLDSVSGANVSITPTAADAAATATIAAGDAITVSVAGPDAAVQEGSDAVFTVTLGGGTPSADVVLPFTLSGVPADDLAPAFGSLSGERRITAAEATSGNAITISIGVVDDARVESAQTLTLTLGALSGGGGGGIAIDSVANAGEASAAIAASDAATAVLSVAAASVAEDAMNAAVQFDIALREGTETRTLTEAATISYTLSGTATGGAADAAARDYTWPSGQSGASGTLMLNSGASGGSIVLPLNDDALNEAAETLAITLTATTGGVVLGVAAERSAQATITDDDGITLTVSALAGTDVDDAAPGVQVSEGAEAAFEIVLSAASAGPVEVVWSAAVQTQANTGDARGGPNTDQNPDLQSRGGTVTIAAGSTTGRIAIGITSDLLSEGAERVLLSLDSVTPGAGAGAAMLSATQSSLEFTIPENSAAQLSLRTRAQTATVSEGGEDVVMVVTLVENESGAHTQTVEVDYTVDGSATAVAPSSAAALGLGRSLAAGVRDFRGAASGTVSFPVGTTMRELRFPTQNDALNEGAETLRINLGAVRVGGQDAAPGATEVETGTATTTIAASDPIMLSLVRVADDPAVVSVDDLPQGIAYRVSFGCADGTSQAAGDCQPVVPTTQITIPYTITLGGTPLTTTPLMANPGQTADQLAPIVVPAQALQQAVMAGAADVVVSLQAPSAATPPPIANAPPISGSATPQAMLLPVMQQTETQRVSVSQTVGMWTVALSLASTNAPEGNAFEVRAVLRGSQALTADLTVRWDVVLASGADAANAADFEGGTPGGNFVFPSGASGGATQTASFRIAADGATENAETFSIVLGAASGGNSAQTAVDATPAQVQIPTLQGTLQIADASAAEGEAAVFRISFATISVSPTPVAVTVAYRLGADGDTATAGADYRGGAASVEIAPGAVLGQTAAEIRVPLLADGQLEGRETFTITLTGVQSRFGSITFAGGAETLRATGTILDTADQSARRRQRVSALATVLDRQTAMLATDAITERLSRPRAEGAQSAELSIANRNFLGARSGASAANARTADGADGAKLGLALYGASGRGGAAAGLPGARAAGRSAGAAFGGLGAGLAGAANMGTRTALPSLAQVLNGSSFRFNAAADVLAGFANFAEGIEVWGSGGYVDLRSGNAQGGLEYGGESIAAFIGADAIVPALPNLTTGLAIGWSAGDLDFTDRAGGFAMRGELSNDALSVHPYFGWQISPHANAWLVLGIGTGSLDIEEREGSGANLASRKLDGGDTGMLMVSTGIAGKQRIGESGDLKLRFALTKVQSRVDSGRFDDGALLPKTRGRSLRLGGEAEAGRRFAFRNGLSLRPFGTLRVRVDNASTDAGVQNAALDWGAGISAAWSDLGLDGRLAFRRQLNDTGDEEQGASLDLNFAPGALGQGLAIALQTAVQQRRPGLAALNTRNGLANLNGAHSASAFGDAFGSGASTGARGVNAGMQHSLSGEIAYGVPLRYHGRSGPGRAALLTPYARFALRSAARDYATGLRLQAGPSLQLSLEAALATTPNTAPDPQLLLTAALHF